MRVLAVIVNIFFPGVGTILVGKIISGVVQFLLYALAVALTATGVGGLFGIPLGVVVWIWGIVSAATAEDKPLVIVVRDSDRTPRAR
jgi:TM2 domain-containing membrane protein YozV